MARIRLIRPEHHQALSDRTVYVLCAVVGTASIGLMLATLWALVSSGYPLLAILATGPLASGLGHTTREWLRLARPSWCKPKI